MSLDLSWSLLDSDLAESMKEKLNLALLRTSRPSFLGPIKISLLDFGTEAMDVTLVEVGDVWRDFSSETMDAGHPSSETRTSLSAGHVSGDARYGSKTKEHGQVEARAQAQDQHRTRASSFNNPDKLHPEVDGSVRVKHHAPRPAGSKPGQGLARFAERNLPFAGGSHAPIHARGVEAEPHASHHRVPRMQTYRQYGREDGRGAENSASMLDRESNWEGASLVGTPAPSGYGWPGAGLGYGRTPASVGPGHGYFPNFSHLAAAGALASGRGGEASGAESAPMAGQALPDEPSLSPSARRPSLHHRRPSNSGPVRSSPAQDLSQPEAATASQLPPIQLHLALDWSTTTFRMTLQTSLLINHPSPAFMELPLSITVTSLALQAGAVIAFEPLSSGKTVHLCLVEPELEEEDELQGASTNSEEKIGEAPLSAAPFARNTASAPSLGEKLIPHLTLESSVGQADKHTLENVGKVERFVLELIRKAVVDEVRLRCVFGRCAR